MPRVGYEFFCEGGCKGWVIVQLDPEEVRNIIMVCPSCKHEHFRELKNGEITGVRHGSLRESSVVHKLEPPLAAFSKTQRLGHLEKKGIIGQAWSRFARP